MSEDKRYQQGLHPDVWEKLSFDQRLATLQAMEIDHAKKGGRDPWEVNYGKTKIIKQKKWNGEQEYQMVVLISLIMSFLSGSS